MPGKLFNSPAQHLLVTLHRFLSNHLNLHGGLIGKAYCRAYFSYKILADRHLISAARKLAKPGMLVVDVGANIGFFSVALARRMEVNLLAFEPDVQNFQNLEHVIAENECLDDSWHDRECPRNQAELSCLTCRRQMHQMES